MAERRDLPLFRWSEERGAARMLRRRIVVRGALLAAGVAALIATIVVTPAPRLVWNASASAPIGLYVVASGSVIGRGDMVIARTPAGVRDLAARRHYIPANVPLVKRVAGTPGDLVCATGSSIRINGRAVATRRAADALGRLLPWWNGCRTLSHGALFLLMEDMPDSFDGRYFGPTPTSGVIGKATLLWRR